MGRVQRVVGGAGGGPKTRSLRRRTTTSSKQREAAGGAWGGGVLLPHTGQVLVPEQQRWQTMTSAGEPFKDRCVVLFWGGGPSAATYYCSVVFGGQDVPSSAL